MRRELIIDHALGITRVAVVEDGVLCEAHIEHDCDTKPVGSLYLGRVQAIRPSVCAAFVDIGLERNAFLPLKPEETLRCGEMIIVQCESSPPTSQKGMRVTMRVTLPGRFLVLIPGGKGIHVSKKIKDEALRDSLEQFCAQICPPLCGLIVRTSAATSSEENLLAEAETLLERWKLAKEKAMVAASPGILLPPDPISLRLSRNLLAVDRILTNDKSLVCTLKNMQQTEGIQANTFIEFFDEEKMGQMLFDAFGLERQIECALERRVWLSCGGYLIFDRCEAMTVIDVNSGKMIFGRDTEDTALRVNLEATDEIVRQLRLRAIGGIIIVDFIDLCQAEHRDALLARMRQVAEKDFGRLIVEDLTRLGLMELTRKRVGEELSQILLKQDSLGTGQPLPDESARCALRDVRRMMLSGQRGPFLIHCGNAVYSMLVKQTILLNAPVYVIQSYPQRSERWDIEQLGDGKAPPLDAVLLTREETI